MKETANTAFVRLSTCKQCKKKFPITCAPDAYGWGLQNGKYVFCSYSCMRAFERPKLKKYQERINKAFEQAMIPCRHKYKYMGRL